MLHQLEEDTCAARMDEGDETVGPLARLAVDELGTGLCQSLQLVTQVGYLDGYMVQALASPGEETAHR